jgi:pentatricopeptide repeat protein
MHTYIYAMIAACDVVRAFEVFDEMKSSGFIPNVQTYTALLHACVEARREEEAISVLREMVDNSLAVSLLIAAQQQHRSELAAPPQQHRRRRSTTTVVGLLPRPLQSAALFSLPLSLSADRQALLAGWLAGCALPSR